MPQIKGDKILVNVEEAGEILSLGRSKLLELTYKGKLPSLKVGRRRLYPLEGLANWAKDQMVEAFSGGTEGDN
jgi:excisionase family DNA binding protein